MAKITLELTASAAGLLDGTESGIDGLQDLAAQGKVTQESLKADFAAAGKSTKEFNQAIDSTVKALADEGKTVEALILKYGSAQKAQRAVTKELTDMAVAGKRTTQEFRELSKVAGNLTDAIADTRAEIKHLASDTSAFDKLAEGARGVAGAMSVAAGASALFGSENENLQRSVQKAQGALALLTGVQELARIATEKGGIATGIATAAQQVYTFAVGESAGALKLFRLALLGTGIGALILVLYEAADAFGFFESKVESTTDKIDEQTTALKALNNEVDRQLRIAQSATKDNIKLIDLEIEAVKKKQAANKQALEQAIINNNLQSGFNEDLKKQVKDLSELDQQYTDDLIILSNKRKFAIEDETKQRSKAVKKLQKDFTAAVSAIDLSVGQQVGAIFGNEGIEQAILDAFSQFKFPQDEMVRILSEKLGLTPEQIAAFLEKVYATTPIVLEKVPEVELKTSAKGKDGKPFSLFDSFLDSLTTKEGQQLSTEQRNAVASATQNVANLIKSNLSDSLSNSIDIQQNIIDSLDDKIEKHQKLVEEERKKAEAGKANSLQQEVAALEKLNAARDKALQKQKAIAKAQLAIDTVTQLSALATAAAQVFAAYADIKGGTIISAALVGVMFAAFAAARVTAAKAAESNPDGFREGGYTGDGDPSEESTKLGNRGYKYHKKEFVANEEMTLKGRDFLEAWHKGDKEGMIYGIDKLLENTGVVLPDESLPRILQTARDEQRRFAHAEGNSELRAIRNELIEVKEEMKQWKKQPKEQLTSHGTQLIVKKGNKTTIISKK